MVIYPSLHPTPDQVNCQSRAEQDSALRRQAAFSRVSVGSSDGILNDILNGRVALGSNTDPHLNGSEDRAQELQFLSPTPSETLTELFPKRLQRNSSYEISLASLAPDPHEQLPFDSSEA